MTNILLKDTLIAQIDKLPYELQVRMLDFTKSLVFKGVKGEDLLRFEGAIPTDELELMSKAIEENCEKVDINGW